jgi:hypothetical protein
MHTKIIKQENHVSFVYISTKTTILNFKIIIKVCKKLEKSNNIIAVLTIGDSAYFSCVESISKSLNIPYLTISNINHNINNDKNHLNMHPTANKIMEAIIDLIDHLQWKRIFVFYQEPERIEYLVSFTNIDDLKYDFKFRLLDTAKPDEWINSINYARQMGYSYFIVDLDAKYINKFLEFVYII